MNRVDPKNFIILPYFENCKPQTIDSPQELWHTSRFAEIIHNVGERLTWPGSWWLQRVVRAFAVEFKPGWLGQKKTALGELAHRIVLVVGGVISFLAVFAFTLIGAVLRSTASYFKNPFVHTPLKTPAPKPTDSFKMLTFNAQLMSEFLCTANHQRPTMQRVDEVAQAVLKTKAEIICLQEVFHTWAAFLLAEKLREQGYHVVYNVGHRILGVNSGLFLASKYPLLNVEFYEHPPLKVGADLHANKGLLLATCQIGERQYVVGNSHFQAGGCDDERKIYSYTCRSIQRLGVASLLDRYAKALAERTNKKIDGVLLGADTNISPTFYHEYRREPGKEKWPKAELDWFLGEEVQAKILSGEMQLPKGPEDVAGWTQFIRASNQVKNNIDKQYQEELEVNLPTSSKREKELAFLEEEKKLKVFLEIHAHKKGPLPSQFVHDMDMGGQPIYQQYIEGTTVDLKATPEPYKDNIFQPERVDYIFARTPVIENGKTAVDQPTFIKRERLHMRNTQEEFTSDHAGVMVEFEHSTDYQLCN